MLSPHIAGVRNKECPTVLALALSHRTCHGPASPQVHARLSAAWMEENGAGKDGESRRKKREEIEKNGIGWKKTERGAPRGSPYPVDSSFRSPLTVLRLFHAGRRDIPALRGEPYDDRGVYHRVVL